MAPRSQENHTKSNIFNDSLIHGTDGEDNTMRGQHEQPQEITNEWYTLSETQGDPPSQMDSTHGTDAKNRRLVEDCWMQLIRSVREIPYKHLTQIYTKTGIIDHKYTKTNHKYTTRA